MQGRINHGSPPREMDTNQLISQEIDELLGRSEESGDQQLEDIEQQIADIEQRQKHDVLQVETYTMMAKYQIMFLKFEDRLKKLSRLSQRKSFMHKMHVFALLKRDQSSASLTNRLAAIKFSQDVQKLSEAANARTTSRLLTIAFEAIRTKAAAVGGFAKEDEKIERLIQGLKRCEAIKATFEKRKPSTLGKKSSTASKLIIDEGQTNDTEARDRSLAAVVSKKSLHKIPSEGLLKQKKQETSLLKQKLQALLASVESFVANVDQSLEQYIETTK